MCDMIGTASHPRAYVGQADMQMHFLMVHTKRFRKVTFTNSWLRPRLCSDDGVTAESFVEFLLLKGMQP